MTEIKTNYMTREQQIAILEDNNTRCQDIMISKSNDYANEDVLSNFKLVAKLENSTPIKDIYGHIANKTVRLGNLLGNDKEPNNESIMDTALDLINYLHLLTMAIDEKEMEDEMEEEKLDEENFDYGKRNQRYFKDIDCESILKQHYINKEQRKKEEEDRLEKEEDLRIIEETESIVKKQYNDEDRLDILFKQYLESQKENWYDKEQVLKTPKTRPVTPHIPNFPNQSKTIINPPFHVTCTGSESEQTIPLTVSNVTTPLDFTYISPFRYKDLQKKFFKEVDESSDVIRDKLMDRLKELQAEEQEESKVPPTVNHISQQKKTDYASKKKSGILSGYDPNGIGNL